MGRLGRGGSASRMEGISPMKIAVLGGGHGAYAAAADLAEQGHEVRLWRRDAQALQPLHEQGGIALKDSQGRRVVALALATGDIGAAVRDAQLLVLPTPAIAQTTARWAGVCVTWNEMR